MAKQNIAIIAGGNSGEYGISIKSGSVVDEMLDKATYNTYLIQIKGSDWFFESDGKQFQIDKNDFSLLVDKTKIHFDCVFCAIHGTPGENGKMPAYFQMLNIPFTASDSLISALTFNKNYCNRVVSTYGVSVAKSIHLFKNAYYAVDEILESLKLPVFVKPNAGGSSVGMSKVKMKDELDAAIKLAFGEDEEVLIEEFIEGRELTCGTIDGKEGMLVLPICEIKSKKEFFDYEAKYNPALAEEIVPADIPEELEILIKQTTAMLYQKLNCKGVIRADYIYSEKDDTLYFIEINTVPGLTKESIVPKMAHQMGISLSELFGMMVEKALQ